MTISRSSPEPTTSPAPAVAPSQQALLVLARLRNGDTYARLAAGFAISTTTAGRYVREIVDLLATPADDVHAAVKRAALLAYAILDGTLIPMDRLADERPYYSGEHKQHGCNCWPTPAGRRLWASPALPGAVHDVSAARAVGLIDALTVAGVKTFADKGYPGPHRPTPRREPAEAGPGTRRSAPACRRHGTPPRSLTCRHRHAAIRDEFYDQVRSDR
ncbi:transposase family protein [Nonomuraea dietziae]|uniref:transposase family protein n=1 Tax=Nonomuraea dietziae TaxID=65515 RepID=UPI003F4DD6AB